ncbi:MAG TPA: hypothetical protein VN721_06920 [Flavipsychrobacter sp.]|nr:hypothetical protein [Flavipsychrobacter sp.]
MNNITFHADIVPIINVLNSTQTFINCIVTDRVDITSANYQSRWVCFKNVEFLQEFSISNISLNIGIEFINCKFRAPLILNNVDATGFDNNFNTDNRNIGFKDCLFKGEISINEITIERDLRFLNCVMEKGISIKKSKIIHESLKFEDTSVNIFFDIFNLSSHFGVDLVSCNINAFVRFEDIVTERLLFNKSTFNERVFIKNGSYRSGITFYNNTCENEVILKDIEDSGTLTINGGIFKKYFIIELSNSTQGEKKKLNTIHLESTEFKNGFYLDGEDSRDLIKQAQIDIININFSAMLQGDITLRHIDVRMLRLSGFSTKTNVIIEYALINELNIIHFFNNAELVFSNVRASNNTWIDTDVKVYRKSVAFISQSNLGKAQFYQMSFNTFDSMTIQDVVLSEIITSNIEWFSKEKIHVDEKARRQLIKRHRKNKEAIKNMKKILASDFQSVREIYRQLKYAMEMNGDKPQALEFQRWEMHNYRKFLKYNRQGTIVDKLILWISQSNNFGQNWLKPTLLLLSLSFIIYVPIALCVNPNILLKPSFSQHDISLTLKVIFYNELKLWFEILNPTHSTNIFGEANNSNGVIYFLDFIERVIVAYFLFQIISAFRKFIKQ